MLSQEDIIKLIYSRLLNEGINKFSLKDLEEIFYYRDEFLDYPELQWINWDLVDLEGEDKAESEYKEIAFESISISCEYLKIHADNNDLEKIFRYEHELLKNVGNIKSYYYMLEDYPDIDFESEYTFDKWTEWKESIEEAVDEYILSFGVYPNILIANKHTLSQIDFLINNIPGEKSEIFKYDEDLKMEVQVDDSEYVELAGYESYRYHINFAYNDKIEDKKFVLVYVEDNDSDDDDDDNDDNSKTPVTPAPVLEKIEK